MRGVLLLPVFAFLLIAAPSQAAYFSYVRHAVTTVNGVSVDRYIWYDSKRLLRTVSLKQEGHGNKGHGGYAVQMTYQIKDGAKTIKVDAENSSDGGFGYFVSHERYRDFTDGANDTIANHVFNTDDSPLGLDFPVVGTPLGTGSARGAAHRFTMTYHHYGTIAGIPKDANGNDVRPTPTDKSELALYPIPVTITWVFQGGKDYPRIDFAVDLSQVAKPDRVNFDVRGPYGVMVFDDDKDGIVDKAMWGDRYHFITTADPVTRNSSWDWSQANAGARYSALTASRYEMGLFEPKSFAASATADSYADERGNNSTAYRHGKGCDGEKQLIPCDWEWPYQSLQYSLPYDNNNASTNFKKMAWGSSPFYGTGTSLTEVYDTGTTFEHFVGWPKNETLNYSVCVVLGLTTSNGLTRTAASKQTSCASTKPS